MSRSTSPKRRLVRPLRAPFPLLGLGLLGLLGLAIGTLGGCHAETSGSTAAAPAPAATSDAPLAGDVIGLPVVFTPREPALIPVGETGTVDLRIEVRRDIQQVRLEVTGDAGLELLARDRVFDLGALAAGDVIARSFDVRTTKDGLHYLKAHVEGLRDGKPLGHSGAVSVLTSEEARRAALETPGRLIVDPSGRRIIEMGADRSDAADAGAGEPSDAPPSDDAGADDERR